MSEGLSDAFKEIDINLISLEERTALHQTLEQALESGEEEIFEFADVTASRRVRLHERSLVRTRTNMHFTRETYAPAQPSPGFILKSTQVAHKSRKSIFRRFDQSDWSTPEYHATYFYDHEEYRSGPGQELVSFNYWPGLNRISIHGKEWLFAELGLNIREPLDVFIGLIRPLVVKEI